MAKPYSTYIEPNMATEAYRLAKLCAAEDVAAASGARRAIEDTKEAMLQGGASRQQQQQRTAKKKSKKSAVVADGLYTARKPILFILAVLMIVVIVFAVLSLVGVASDITSMFMSRSDKDLVGRSFADPIMSLVTYFGGDEKATWSESDMISQSFFTDCLSTIIKTDANAEISTTNMLCYLALPIVLILFLVTVVYLALKYLAAMIKGKKYKFGYSIFVGILYLLAIGVLTVVWNGYGINELMHVLKAGLGIFGITGKATTAALGFGFYVTLIVFVLALILNIFAYKKNNNYRVK